MSKRYAFQLECIGTTLWIECVYAVFFDIFLKFFDIFARETRLEVPTRVILAPQAWQDLRSPANYPDVGEGINLGL